MTERLLVQLRPWGAAAGLPAEAAAAGKSPAPGEGLRFPAQRSALKERAPSPFRTLRGLERLGNGVERAIRVLITAHAAAPSQQAAMKAVVASSRLGNHGHHDCSRSGRSQGGPRDACLPQGTGTAGPEATATEDRDAFRSDCPAVSKVPVNGAGCKS